MEHVIEHTTNALDKKDRRLLFFIIVSVMISSWVLTKEPAEIYGGYFVILVLLPVFVFRYGIPPTAWIIITFFIISGTINIVFGNDTAEQFLKIFIGVTMSYLFYYFVLVRFDYDVKVVFEYYLKGAWIVTLIGAMQFASYVVHFKPGYDFRWLPMFNKWGVILGGNLGIRVNSIFGEPSTYAAVMAPAMFIALYNVILRKQFVFRRLQSIVVLVVYLLTFSSLGYLGILAAIIILMMNYGLIRVVLLFIPAFVLAFYYLYSTVPDFQYRWDSLIDLFQTGKVDIRTQHGSSIVFYNNFIVATENLQRNFLFGTGLGSHPVAFDKYSITKDIQTFGFANNSSDANSMLLRIISEIGLVGIVGVFLFLKRGYVRRNADDPEQNYWLISSACLCIFILYLMRQGHYFLNGFPFFVWIYYYARKNTDAYYLEQEEAGEENEAETESETVEPESV